MACNILKNNKNSLAYKIEDYWQLMVAIVLDLFRDDKNSCKIPRADYLQISTPVCQDINNPSEIYIFLVGSE